MDYELLTNANVKIGQKAPDFEAITTFGNIKLEDYKGKWLVLFSHPGDFTPVCSYNLGKVDWEENESCKNSFVKMYYFTTKSFE